MQNVEQRAKMLKEQLISTLTMLVLENKSIFIDNFSSFQTIRNYMMNSEPMEQYRKEVTKLMQSGADAETLKMMINPIMDEVLYSELDIEQRVVMSIDRETQPCYVRIISSIEKNGERGWIAEN